ncbi:hypothetical protein ACFL5W_01435 [Thermodesulfobacteriota bacterium]
MAVKISDTALLKVIQTYKNAEKICKEAGITLKTLQTRVAKLTYKNILSNPSDIVGLYRPVSNRVKLNQNSIIIPKTKLEDSDFDTGDTFEIDIRDSRIILTKI